MSWGSIYSSVNHAKNFNKTLMKEYVEKAEDCYKNNDFEGRDYWNERYFETLQQNELLDRDIQKLEREMTQS